MLTYEAVVFFREGTIYSLDYIKVRIQRPVGLWEILGKSTKGVSLGNNDHSPIQGLCIFNVRQALKEKKRRNELVSSEASTLLLSPTLSTSGAPALVV